MKTRADVEALMTRVFSELQETREAGQKEYAHDEENALANFERTASEIDSTREKVLWTFAVKHKDGIAAWIKGHRSQCEDVRGRIKDLIVYLILLWAMVDDEEPESTKPTAMVMVNALLALAVGPRMPEAHWTTAQQRDHWAMIARGQCEMARQVVGMPKQARRCDSGLGMTQCVLHAGHTGDHENDQGTHWGV